jgi:hypothetical protein
MTAPLRPPLKLGMTQNQWLRAHPVSSKYGAPMGRPDDQMDPEQPVHIEAVRSIDGGYDYGGAYFGHQYSRDRLFAVWYDDPDDADPTTSRASFYLWAPRRRDVVRMVLNMGYTLVPGCRRT